VLLDNEVMTVEEFAARSGQTVDEVLASFGACFSAGMPLRTPTGEKAIELFRSGDVVLSKDEYNAEGPIEGKTVEAVFVRTGKVWALRVGGQVIRTTAEHPFYTRDRGWARVDELVVGDALLTAEGQWVSVNESADTGLYETVYNLRVADYHTYFVGAEDWGFSVWAHNACTGTQANDVIESMTGKRLSKNTQAEAVARAVNSGNEPLVRQLLEGYGVPQGDVGPVTARLFTEAGVTPQPAPSIFPKSGLTAADLQPPPGAPVGRVYRVNGQEPVVIDMTNPNWKQAIPLGTPTEGIYIVRTQQGQLLKVGDLSTISRLGQYRGWVTGDAIPVAVDYYPLQRPLPGPLRRVAQDLRSTLQSEGWNLPRDWENIGPNAQPHIDLSW
jgi:hypothetical protein